MPRNVGWMLDQVYEHLFEEMQREGYVRSTGFKELNDYGETDLAYAWHEWWDAGDE